MWIAIAIVAAFFLISALTPKQKVENARQSTIGDFTFPRSQYGDPIPIIYGTVRQKAPILSWYGDFNSIPITREVKTGLFSKTEQTIGWKNYIGLEFILCLGEAGVTLEQIWCENRAVWSGNNTFGGLQIEYEELFGGEEKGGGLYGYCDFYPGREDEYQDDYLVQKIGPDAPPYRGMARIVFKEFYVGTTTQLRPFSFVLSRFPRNLHSIHYKIGQDSNPMEVAYDLITAKWGRLGNPSSVIDRDSFVIAASTLYNEGLGMSLLVQNASSGKDLLEECMRVADGFMFQDPSTGKIKVKLVRDDYNVSFLPVVDESVIIDDIKDFGKTLWEATFNQVRVTFKNRTTHYDESVAVAQDFASVNKQSKLKSTTLSMPGVMMPSVASKVASRHLSMLSVPLFKCEIRLNRKMRELRPGDVFVLKYAKFRISQMIMRVTKVDFGDMLNNEIKVTCIQDKFGEALTLIADPTPSDFVPIDTQAKAVVTRRAWAPPTFLVRPTEDQEVNSYNNSSYFMTLAKPPSGSSMSYNLAFSDNASTVNTLTLEKVPYSGVGTLLNAYGPEIASDTRHDTSGTLRIGGLNLYEVSRLRANTTLSAARDGTSLLLINDELFVYVGFTVEGGGIVRFNNVYRSVLDTLPGNHVANDQVWIVRAGSGVVGNELITYGQTRYFKMMDQTGTSAYPIPSAVPFSGAMVDRASRPLQPQFLTLEGEREPVSFTGLSELTLSWRRRTREDIELQVYSDGDRAPETHTRTRIRWRIDSGAWTTQTSTGTTATLSVGASTGLLEVLVDSENTITSKISQVAERITVPLV